MKPSACISAYLLLFATTLTSANAQVNRPPIFISHFPIELRTVSVGKPFTIIVSAKDPEGEAVSYAWKRDGVIVQSGPDSTFTTTYSGAYGDPHVIFCIASDPEGLKDSVMFAFTLTAIGPADVVPKDFALWQNYPNPFNPSTTIRYSLVTSADVSLTVFNSLGQVVAKLVDEREESGIHQVKWVSSKPSGVYFYRFEAGSFTETRSMLLLK